MYNIYINEVRLTLTENVPNGLIKSNLLEEKDFDIVKFHEKVAQQSVETDFLIYVPNSENFLNRLTAELYLIEAAGGLVQNAEGAYLFIFRRGKWDLPKGKIDEGESKETAAVREVEEECGIQVSDRGALLKTTYHIYPFKGSLVLKPTYWYAMKVEGVPTLVPQLEEEITDAVWLKPDELDLVRANTYPLILEVISGIGS